MEPSKESRYKTMLSSTAILGGTQVLTGLINAIRGKLVAVILHAVGMGMMSLLTNAANTIQQFALLGINFSAVRSISQANEDDRQSLALIIKIVRSLILLTSISGIIITLALSPLLAKISFNSSEYTPYFLLLSIFVFFSMMGVGESAIAQGLRRYKLIAMSSVVPPLCGLFLSIPIYYLWGVEGIVPAMILGSIIYFVVLRWKLQHGKERIPHYQGHLSFGTIWTEGKDIIQFGLVLMVGTLAGTLTTFLINITIQQTGSLTHVGLYQAANAITVQYLGMIFTAMATDYYPKLASLVKNKAEEAFAYVNQQTEIVLLIVTPLTLLTILTAPLLIRILLTREFLQITTMVQFIALSTIFNAFCFPLNYIAYAKGDKSYIFWIETVWGNAKNFIVIITCYYFWQLDGLGYGVLCSSVIDVFVSLTLIRYRYGFKPASVVTRLLVLMIPAGCVCLAGALLPITAIYRYALMTGITAVVSIYCIQQIRRRICV